MLHVSRLMWKRFQRRYYITFRFIFGLSSRYIILIGNLEKTSVISLIRIFNLINIFCTTEIIQLRVRAFIMNIFVKNKFY